MTETVFKDIPIGAVFESHHLNALFEKEANPRKVNLTVGAYRTEEGLPWVLTPVSEAERRLAADPSLNHEYLPVLGFEPFCKAATEFILGNDSPAILEERVTSVQAISGTGCLRAGAEFLAKVLKMDTVYVSTPTWVNHKAVFSSAGFTNLKDYPYYNPETKKIAFDDMWKTLNEAPERSVVVLHACAHNPSGKDLKREQWMELADLIKRRRLFPFFDSAYLGFVTGNPSADAWPIRYFVSQGLEMFIAQSFAKTMGLYNERVGNLTIVLKGPEAIEAVRSQMSLLIRANWSNPPSHGAKVAHLVLTDPTLRQEWLECIKTMWDRIIYMRCLLFKLLGELGTPGNWDHITKQKGLFSYSGLTEGQVKHLVEVCKIFLLKDGRMNICGLNTKNVAYVARSIDYAVRHIE